MGGKLAKNIKKTDEILFTTKINNTLNFKNNNQIKNLKRKKIISEICYKFITGNVQNIDESNI